MYAFTKSNSTSMLNSLIEKLLWLEYTVPCVLLNLTFLVYLFTCFKMALGTAIDDIMLCNTKLPCLLPVMCQGFHQIQPN